MAPTPQYLKRDRCLLEHAALYRIVLPPAAAAVFSGGRAIPHVFTRLVDDGMLAPFPRALPGGLSYFAPTPKGCAAANAPRERAALLQGAALDLAIGVSFFCNLCRGQRRYRLDAKEADQLFETSVPANVPFVVSDELDGAVKAFRVFQAASLRMPEVLRRLRVLLDQIGQEQKLDAWVQSRQLGFAVLTPTASAKAALEKCISKSGLIRSCQIIVDLGPDANNLAAALKGRR
jgi:hypothetical protein